MRPATDHATRRRTLARRAGVALLVLVATGCGSGRAVESKAVIPRSPGNLTGTHWILVATHDSDQVPASTSFTLDIEAGTASGTGPCNRYHLSFTHEDSDVTTGPVASTQVACPSPLDAAEYAYFTALEAVDHADREGTESQLVLTGPHDVRLVYDRADRDAAGLAGTWNIVNYAAPGALTTPVTGTHPTLDFGSDHALTVDTGCNIGHATWNAHGRSLTISQPRATLKACPAPQGLSEQDSHILVALPQVASVDRARVDAVLLDGQGRALFVLEPHT